MIKITWRWIKPHSQEVEVRETDQDFESLKDFATYVNGWADEEEKAGVIHYFTIEEK